MKEKFIRSYYVLNLLFNFSASFIWGINTLFLLKIALSIFQVFLVNAFYSFSMAVFEIPTGIYADTFGRKKSFLLSCSILLCGTILYGSAGYTHAPLLWVSIASFVLGIAYTFFSGALEAWFVDGLHALDASSDPATYFSKSGTISAIFSFLGSILGGIVGTYNLEAPYFIRAFFLLIALFYALFTMKEYGFTKQTLKKNQLLQEFKSTFSISIRFTLAHKPIIILYATGFVFSLFLMYGWYALAPYLLDLYGHKDAIWISGLASACCFGAQAIGSFQATKFNGHFKRKTSFLALTYLLQSIGLVIVVASKDPWLVLAGFTFTCYGVGLLDPIRSGFLHLFYDQEPHNRATLVSFDSLLNSLGSTIGQSMYGSISDFFSIRIGYLVGACMNVIPIVLLRRLQRKHIPEDDNNGASST